MSDDHEIVTGKSATIRFDGIDPDTASVEELLLALCRCSQSNRKPFCDGSHTRVGFTAP